MTLTELGRIPIGKRTATQCMSAFRDHLSHLRYDMVSPLFLNFIPEDIRPICEAQCDIEGLKWPKIRPSEP